LVGDKYPYITEHAEYIYRVFGGAKIVVILRHPYGVCESIKRRFEDPADKFNLSPEQGLRRWNRCLVDVMKSYKDGQKIYIVNYDKIFLNTDAIKIMYDVLGLSLTEADQSRLNSIIKKAEQLKSTESGISEEIIDLVDRKADFNLYRELLNFKCILKDY
jgi:hypothetical protein